MRILTAITYYRPYTSGLTIYAERLAKALVRKGHEVTVLAMQHQSELARDEMLEGVRVLRAPALARVSKGIISPSFYTLAFKELPAHDVVHMHLPQFDAAGIAMLARLRARPAVITYHCDLLMPPGLGNQMAGGAVHLMDYIAGLLADRVVTYTEDYGRHSPYLRRFTSKLAVILPPVVLPETSAEAAETFRRTANPQKRRPVIAMAARFAAEKGVETLLDAMPEILRQFPEALVLFAGQYREVLGEKAYFERLRPRVEAYEAAGQWRFLGVLGPSEMASFYRNIDLLLVPSLNSTESFGLVQIEAMMNGVPAVASDLPGVRQPVIMSGMGEIAKIGDAASLAAMIIKVLQHPASYRRELSFFQERFNPEATAERYLELYTSCLQRRN